MYPSIHSSHDAGEPEHLTQCSSVQVLHVVLVQPSLHVHDVQSLSTVPPLTHDNPHSIHYRTLIDNVVSMIQHLNSQVSCNG